MAIKKLIFIPAHNEELNIVNTVHQIQFFFLFTDFIVINDGSSDTTAAVCRANGFPLIDLPVNLGLSGAFQTGIRYAWENEYDAAIQIDGDGQHDPSFISQMEAKMEEEDLDIVIGSRFVTERKPHTMRMLGSSLLSAAILFTTHQYIGDPTSGMRLYNKRMLELFANNINYGPEPDTIAYLIHCGFKIKEIQVTMNERTAGTSYLTPFRSAGYMLNMAVSILLVQFFR